LIFENFDYGFKRAALLEAYQQNTIYAYLEICYSYADANSCGGRHEARNIYQKVVTSLRGKPLLFFLSFSYQHDALIVLANYGLGITFLERAIKISSKGRELSAMLRMAISLVFF
jgi:hypothetical protein